MERLALPSHSAMDANLAADMLDGDAVRGHVAEGRQYVIADEVSVGLQRASSANALIGCLGILGPSSSFVMSVKMAISLRVSARFGHGHACARGPCG